MSDDDITSRAVRLDVDVEVGVDVDADATTRELRRLSAGVRRCRACRLWRSRQHAVPGFGPAGAPVVLVGEGPGADEDRHGRPFVGRAGRFLDELLARAGLDRPAVYLTNSVRCRPPGNRLPRADELRTCHDRWLEPELELVGPRVIVLLGATALRAVLGVSGRLDQLHGRVWCLGGREVLATYHPAAGMRFPDIGRRMIDDFDLLRVLLDPDRVGAPAPQGFASSSRGQRSAAPSAPPLG